jgi:uncharacterized protein YggT (Ycf19 family)
MEALSSVATAFGLSATAGLNAYLPLLVVALTAKYTHLIELNDPWNVLTSWWVIGLLAVLLIIEMTVDKVPAVDTVNDIIQTFGRPLAGAILFASTSGVIGNLHPVLAVGAGILLAGSIHTVKSMARPVVTASTAGTGNWLVSILEDILALIGAVLAILLPILIALIVGFLLILFVWWWGRQRRKKATA